MSEEDKSETKEELFNLSEINNETLYKIYHSLVIQKLSPITLLENVLDNFKSKKYLPIVGLALRFGADPNHYIDDEHIMVAVDKKISDKDLSFIVIMLLCLSGSDGELRWSRNKDTVKSVNQWFKDKMYKFKPNDICKYAGNSLSRKNKEIIDIILDIDNGNIITDYSMLDYILTSKSSKSLNLIAENCVNYYEIIDSYFVDAFEHFIKKGVMLNYQEVNYLFLKISKSEGIYLEALMDMTIIGIDNGMNIDRYQLSIIKKDNDNLSNEIISSYQKPFWIKECNGTK